MLKNLVDAYAKLSELDQRKELELKMKQGIALLNKVNKAKELLIIPVDSQEGPHSLVHIYSLLCCLEDEIAKLFE